MDNNSNLACHSPLHSSPVMAELRRGFIDFQYEEWYERNGLTLYPSIADSLYYKKK